MNDIINDRYRIIKKLGIGGSAVTYQAEDLQNNQQVAIKVLSLKQIDDWKKVELFTREAEILKQLNHQNLMIKPIHATIEDVFLDLM